MESCQAACIDARLCGSTEQRATLEIGKRGHGHPHGERESSSHFKHESINANCNINAQNRPEDYQFMVVFAKSISLPYAYFTYYRNMTGKIDTFSIGPSYTILTGATRKPGFLNGKASWLAGNQNYTPGFEAKRRLFRRPSLYLCERSSIGEYRRFDRLCSFIKSDFQGKETTLNHHV